VTAAARSLIAQLRQAGATLTCGDDGKVRFCAPVPLPVTLLAEARKHREAIAVALIADTPKRHEAGGSMNAWGFTLAERAAASARLLPQRSEATSAAAHTADLTRRAGFGVGAVTTEYASNGMPLSLVLMAVDNPVDSRWIDFL
jgi:hypothetical protein